MATLLVRVEDTHQDEGEAIPHTEEATVAIPQEAEAIPHHVETTTEEVTADSVSDHPMEVVAVKNVAEAEETTAVDTMNSAEEVEVVGGTTSLQEGMMMISAVGMEAMNMGDHLLEAAVVDAPHHVTGMITIVVKGLAAAAAGIRYDSAILLHNSCVLWYTKYIDPRDTDTQCSTASLTLDCMERNMCKSNRTDR
ncbi:hypothetical protein TWF751_010717 [Orbilia oligospora]|nr:hypothetical protein TWF751_010717 [Orbilia oligospora]